jgi:hypothetical protein
MKIILKPPNPTNTEYYYEKSYSHEHEHKILIEKPITLFSKISKDCEIWLYIEAIVLYILYNTATFIIKQRFP